MEYSSRDIVTGKRGFRFVDLGGTCKGLVYNGFRIRNPRSGLFEVLADKNTADYAVWQASFLLKSDQWFQGCVARRLIPPEIFSEISVSRDLTAYCTSLYADEPGVTGFSCERGKFQGCDSVRYVAAVHVREQDNNGIAEGIMLFAPDEPGAVIDIQVWEFGHGISAEKRDPELEKIVKQFFELIEIGSRE